MAAGPVPHHHEGIDALLQLGGAMLVVLDDNHVLTLRRESFGEIAADSSGADDDYSHFRIVTEGTEATG
jgi:hypothetical protein